MAAILRPFVFRLFRRQVVLAGCILFGLLILAFAPCVFGNKTLIESARGIAASIMPYGAWAGQTTLTTFARTKDPGAAAWEAEPLLQLTRQEYLKEKTLPIWNPYQAFGTPLAASMQPQTYNPLTLWHALMHSPRAQNWYFLLRLFCAGFFAYLYARLFVSFIPALAAGLTTTFAGYYLLYITTPHLSVEMLLSVALFCGELILRQPQFKSIAWFAILLFFALTGGMPESSFLLFVFTFTYIGFRLISDPSFRKGYRRRLQAVGISTLLGFGLSGILLLPFRQYMRYSFDTHQFQNTNTVTGLIHDVGGSSAFTYLLPLLYGPGWDNNLRNYIGIVAFFLAITAVLSVSWRNEGVHRTLTLLTCFFGGTVLVIVLKRYGVFGVNALGALPIFKLVLFPKYQEPILSFAVSVLVSIGLERLMKWRVSPVKLAAALALSSLLLAVAVWKAREVIGRALVANKTSADIVAWSILLPACLLIVTSLLFVLFNRRQTSQDAGMGPGACAAMLVLLACESLGNYFLPTYYVWNELPTVASNPYVGAPFVDRLRSLTGFYRIFAEDGVLHPNWASAFSLFDIRDLDAMYYRKYLPFIRTFFPGRSNLPGQDRYDRFTGADNYQFNSPTEQRLLQMSSVKYIITMPGTMLGRDVVEEIIEQNRGKLAVGRENHISRQVLAVGGETRVALGEHPPYTRLPYHLTVPKGSAELHFSVGINPAAFAVCGDGVEFIVEARDTSGAIKKLFSRFIDPRHDTTLRHWIDGSADLSRYKGHDIDVLLSTNGGPKGDICADWAVWSDFHFDNRPSPGPFKLIYKKEVNIFEFQQVLPRAAIYFNASVESSEEEVRTALPSLSLDVFKTVLLSRRSLNHDQVQWVNAMNQSLCQPVQAAKVTSYSSREVTVEANLDRRGILVLNDADFPGWSVETDGKLDAIVTANYLFRGVLLNPGRHTLRFSYDPKSVRMGEAISIASLFSFGILGWISVRKQVL